LTIVDRIVLVVGLLALGFGAWQAANSRPFELFVVAGVVLAVAALFRPGLRLLKFGPTGAELQIVEVKAEVEAQLNDTRQAPDLKLTISSAIFDVPWGALGTDHAVEVSAVNTSTGPIGVNSIGLTLTDGKWAPAMHQLPMHSVVELPGVLQPQQRAVAYFSRDGLRDSLRENGIRIVGVVANLADGSTRTAPAPEDWRNLGDPD
jgi:hypothetical protein